MKNNYFLSDSYSIKIMTENINKIAKIWIQFFSFWNFNNFDYFAIREKNNFEIRYHISQKLCNLIKYFAKSYFSGSQ